MKSRRQFSALLATVFMILTILLLASLTGREKTSAKIPSENGTLIFCFSMQEDCARKLASLIENAASVKAALYDLDEPEIKNLLLEKNADVIIDEDNYFGYGTKMETPGLMHDKFFIIYNSSGKDYVVTGSTNPTVNDFRKNDNNMVIISSNQLKANYEAEFSELKTRSPNAATKQPRIMFNGFEIENYFCPDDDCEEKVLDELSKAGKSIKFMVFSFTSDRMGRLIASKKGVIKIEGIFDNSQVAANREYSEFHRLNSAGISVKIENSTGKLHHKVFIIDGEVVITGSYNPTSAGNAKNDENILIIHSAEIAAEYNAEFERIWGKN